MPEGDTIFRTAARLRQVLEGKFLRRAEVHDGQLQSASISNRVVRQVEARGKHLLIHLDDGSAIHSHLGMNGSWHVYRQGDPWQKPSRNARLTLDCGEYLAVCFRPKLLEHLSPTGLRRHPYLQRLGPDLLASSFSFEEVLRRFRAHDAVAIGEAVVNQSIVSGIGNVYKSEMLFVCRVDPFARVADLSDEQLRELMSTAVQLMRRNLEGNLRRTRFQGQDRYWVYGRGGRPCLHCDDTVRLRRQGDLGRSTYWCPSCQQNCGND